MTPQERARAEMQSIGDWFRGITAKDAGQGASRTFWAGGLGAPADMGTTLANLGIAGGGYLAHKAGLINQPPNLLGPSPYGSEAIAGGMKLRGLLDDNRGSPGDTVGEFGLNALVPVAQRYAPQIAAAANRGAANLAAPQTLGSQRGVANFDPRFDPRVKEAGRLERLTPQVTQRQTQTAPQMSLADFEGHPFITSMSDRTAAGGWLTGVNDVKLNRPVNLQGGQDFMFENPGAVWASAPGPVKQIMGLAGDIRRVTGKDPLFLPWRMAPSGGDFASMTGETMLSYAGSALGKREAARLDKAIKQYIPGWRGVASDESVAQFRSAPDTVRKGIKNMMDVEFRERGGLSIGEARLSVADPKQYNAPDGGVMNIGRIFSGGQVDKSNHFAYPRTVPGEGIGRVANPHGIYELLPSVASARGVPNPAVPRATDLRALQMKPYAGLLDAELLKSLGY